MAPVTPWGKANGEAWTAAARATRAREYLMLILRVWRRWRCWRSVEVYCTGDTVNGLQVNEGSTEQMKKRKASSAREIVGGGGGITVGKVRQGLRILTA